MTADFDRDRPPGLQPGIGTDSHARTGAGRTTGDLYPRPVDQLPKAGGEHAYAFYPDASGTDAPTSSAGEDDPFGTHLSVRSAPASSTPGTSARQTQLGSAAKAVSEAAFFAQGALQKRHVPEPELLRLGAALEALGQALHEEDTKHLPTDDKEIASALRASRQIAIELSRRLGPGSAQETELLKRIHLVQGLTSHGTETHRGPADIKPSELLPQVERSLDILEGARDLAASIPDVNRQEIDAAIEKTKGWHEALGSPGATQSEARRLSTAVLQQQSILFDAQTELEQVFAKPIGPGTPPTIRAYLHAMAQSTKRERVAERALAQARSERRRMPIANAENSLATASVFAAEVGAYDSLAGDKADRELKALNSQRKGLERTLVAGGHVSDYDIRKLEVDSRELRFKQYVKSCEVKARALAGVLDTSDDGWLGVPNKFDFDMANLRTDLLSMAEEFPIELEHYKSRIAKADDAYEGDLDGLWKLLHAREAALDEAEQRIDTWIAKSEFYGRLQEATDKQKSAEARMFAMQLLTTIAITLAGNVAAAGVRGATRAAWAARATRAGMSADAALAEANAVANAAGAIADAAVNTTGQVAMGDDASLFALVTMNVLSPLVLARIQTRFPPIEAINANVPRWQKAVVGAGAFAYDKLDLSISMIAGAGLDYASRLAIDGNTQGFGEADAERWLYQGAAMAIGRHLSSRSKTIVDRLNQIEAISGRAVEHLVGRAEAISRGSTPLQGEGDPAAAIKLLHSYDGILVDAAAHIESIPPARPRSRPSAEPPQHESSPSHASDTPTAYGSRAAHRHADGENSIPTALPDQPTAKNHRPTPDGPRTDVKARVPYERAREAGHVPPDVEAALASPERVAELVNRTTGVDKGEFHDRVDRVAKGPKYDEAMAQLREFYSDMEAEAQGVNPTVGYATDGKYGWTYGHDAQTFSHGLANVVLRVHLKPAPGVSDADVAHLKAQVRLGIDKHYNFQHQVRGADGVERRLHMEIEFVDAPGTAHIVVTARPGDGRADVNNWFVEGHPTSHAHEATHGAYGVKDEYVDPTVPDRATRESPGVHEGDGSIMGDYWTGPAGQRVPGDGTRLLPRHLEHIGKMLPTDVQSAIAAATGMGRAVTDAAATLRDYFKRLSITGGVPPPSARAAQMPDSGNLLGDTAALGDFHGTARTGNNLALSTVRTHILNDLALIAPPNSHLVNDHTLQIDAGATPTRVVIDVGETESGAVASHARHKDGDVHVTVSERARDADVTRALASELAIIHRSVVGDDARTAHPPDGLEGRAAEAAVLLDNLDRSSARGGEHLDSKQIAKDLQDLFRSLQVDASPAGRQRLNALLGHDPPHLRRAVMMLEGFELRPNLDASSDLRGYAGARKQHLAQLRDHVDGKNVDDLVSVEDLALGAQLRMEEGHRIFDAINPAAGRAKKLGVREVLDAHRNEMVQTLNDGSLPLGRKQAALDAQIEKLVGDPRLAGVVGSIDAAKAHQAVRALGASDHAHGVMLLDPATGDLVDGSGKTGPRSMRELMARVDRANQAAAANGIAIEYVIVVHRPGRSASGGEVAHVEVSARRRARSRLPDRRSPGLPDHDGGGDLIVDVGVGRGNFAAELAARGDGQVVVQTEHILSADVGQMSRDMPGIADAGPLAIPGAVMVYGDVLSRLDLLRGAAFEADAEGIHRLFLNNVSAGFRGPSDYAALAEQLAANMADGGTVEVQWTMSPERVGGARGSRGHIRGDLLVDGLSETHRSFVFAAASVVQHDYTLNSSKRSQAGADDAAQFDPPVPEERYVITFLGPATARHRKDASK